MYAEMLSVHFDSYLVSPLLLPSRYLLPLLCQALVCIHTLTHTDMTHASPQTYHALGPLEAWGYLWGKIHKFQ